MSIPKKELIFDIKNKKYFINTKDQFLKNLKNYLNSKYTNKPLSSKDKNFKVLSWKH